MDIWIWRKLEYKAKWYERELIKVDAKYTSQTCSNCGHKDKKNRQSQSVFKCVDCGHKENADVNAAINIFPSVLNDMKNLKHIYLGNSPFAKRKRQIPSEEIFDLSEHPQKLTRK